MVGWGRLGLGLLQCGGLLKARQRCCCRAGVKRATHSVVFLRCYSVHLEHKILGDGFHAEHLLAAQSIGAPLR